MTDKGKLRRIFLAILLGAPAALLPVPAPALPPARTADQPDFTFTPSPADWRALPIYQIITDRFDDGDPANNTAHPGITPNPFSMDGLHGGDFAGIERRLDYIAALGFRTIWISPVYLNHHAAYHGYHITDFNRVDPHWGTLAELRRLIDAAHARGLYVVLDVVFNHMARLVVSDEPGYPRFREHPYRLRWRDPAETYAAPFDDLTLFHGHGSIGDWEDQRHNELGDLQGLPDLITTDPRVRRALLESHLAWIAATDCDGFRVDTAHHVELDFWQEVLPALHEGAAALGKTNFLIFAEALKGDDEIVARLTREGAFFSALYYPYYFTLIDWWGRRGPTRIVGERWSRLERYGPARDRLVVFADNHDRARLLHPSYLDGDTNRAAALLTSLYATPGIPAIYYGTEQGFAGAKGHTAREPMFDSAHRGTGDRFHSGHPLARHLTGLNAARAAYPALSFGTATVLFDENQAGLLVVRRGGGPGEPAPPVLLLANNSTQPRAYALDAPHIDILTGIPYDGTVPPDHALLLVEAAHHTPLPPPPGASDHSTEPRPGPSPPPAFILDGYLDAAARPVDGSAGRLHAAYDPAAHMLYLAVAPAAATEDRFIFIAREPGTAAVDAPWEKAGTVPEHALFIAHEGTSDYAGVRGHAGRHGAAVRKDGVLEAMVHWPDPAATVHLAVRLYQTQDGGAEIAAERIPREGWLEFTPGR